MENINTSAVTKSPQATVKEATVPSVASSFEELYLKKDYKGAANYLLQNKKQLSSGIFHYNLGTVYSKLGDFPAARFHLEKAIKDGYINSSSLNNLSYIKNQLQVDDLSNSTSIPDQIMNSALMVPSSGYLSLALILILIGLLFIRSKKLIKKISIIIFFIIAISPILFSGIFLNKINYAVAFKDIPLYEGPSKIFTEKGKVRAGSKIILGEFKDGWFYVKFPISLTGWVSKDQLGHY